MKIISPYKDYYDKTVQYGQDFDIIYIRKPIEIPKTTNALRYGFRLGNNCIGTCYIFGVAGKLYPAITINLKWPAYFDLTSFCDEAFKLLTKKEMVCFCEDKKRYIWRRRDSINSVKYFYEEVVKEPAIQEATKLTFDRGHPTFVMSYNEIIVNHRLEKTGISKVINSYQMYQQIQTFLAKYAKPEKVIPKIDDKTMAEIKGFDKYSFRKSPA